LSTRSVWIIALSLAVLQAGCSSDQAATWTSTSTSTSTDRHASPPSAPVSDDRTLCSGEAAKALLVRFAAAFNQGEDQLVERFMTTAERWAWWRDPRHEGEPVPYDRLPAYLRAIRDAGIRLRPFRFRFEGFSAVHDTGDFTFALRRPGRTPGSGKGAVDCETGRFEVITIDTW
jgi:hypothetical protein